MLTDGGSVSNQIRAIVARARARATRPARRVRTPTCAWQTGMRLQLVGALAKACAAVCFLPCYATASVNGSATMPKGAMLWVYRCDDNGTSWGELVQYLGDVAKPAGVTSVSLCAYRIAADGSFGYRTSHNCVGWLPSAGLASEFRHNHQDKCSLLVWAEFDRAWLAGAGPLKTETTPYGPKDCGQNQEKYISKVAATGLKQFPLIDCHAGIDSVRLMMNTTVKRKAFITAAVAKMKAQKFEGYNLDIEIGGTSADAVLYTQFVSEFAEALHAAGGMLSSDSKLMFTHCL